MVFSKIFSLFQHINLFSDSYSDPKLASLQWKGLALNALRPEAVADLKTAYLTYTSLTIKDIQTGINLGHTTPEAVEKVAIFWLRFFNPHINSCVTIFDQADVHDTADGVLKHIPMVHKDTRPYTDGQGSGIKANKGVGAWLKDFDWATVPSTVKEGDLFLNQGAGVVGISTSPQLGLHAQTRNIDDGITRNFFNFYKTSGGSSGGSGVAVASGAVKMASSSDIGGSGRIPAWGVVGMVPATANNSTPFASFGWMRMGAIAQSVEDVVRGMFAVSAIGKSDMSFEEVLRVCQAPRKPFTIGMASRTAFVSTEVDKKVVLVTNKTAQTLESAGHKVIDLDSNSEYQSFLAKYPPKKMAQHFAMLFAKSGVTDFVKALSTLHRPPKDAELETFTHVMNQLGQKLTTEDIDSAEQLFQAYREDLAQLKDRLGIELTVSPLMVVEPINADDIWPEFPETISDIKSLGNARLLEIATANYEWELAMFNTSSNNAEGSCALVFPTTETLAGVPINMQISGPGCDKSQKPFGIQFELDVLSLAFQLEEKMPWHSKLLELRQAQFDVTMALYQQE